MPQVAGLVLNKNETPFAPLYWDRYEQIKNARRADRRLMAASHAHP